MAIQMACPILGKIRRPINSKAVRRAQSLICVRSSRRRYSSMAWSVPTVAIVGVGAARTAFLGSTSALPDPSAADGFAAQRASRIGGVDTSISPPCGFVAAPVHLAMVPAAEWNRELIADLAAECSTLRKAKVVGVRRQAAANQARLPGYKSDVISVTHPSRFRHGQHALINRPGAPPVLWLSLSKMRQRRCRRGPFARFRCVSPADP
jgi:hypothetical protein